MVISHGNGLAIGGFRAFGAALEPEFEVIAVDLRGHGDSGPTPVLAHPWPRYLADIPEIFDHITSIYGDKPTHGAFHSLSAAATLLAQGRDPRPWRSLSVFEPPVPPVPDLALCEALFALHASLAERTRKRRFRFAGPSGLVASLRKSPTFGGIAPDDLHRLARAMLWRSDADPAAPWELVCAPELEANIFDSRGAGLDWDCLGAIDCPVQVVLGSVLGHDMPLLLRSGTVLARSFGFAGATVEGGGHLMQLQRPGRSAELAIGFAQAPRAAGR
jgi:pimeloyl-ACP methyl ester carboxylesterase